MDSKLFASVSKKLQLGEEATHKEFELFIGKITVLQSRAQHIHENLVSLQIKCSRLFVVSRRPSKKRKQKQNKIKSEKAKKARREENCQRVVEIIAPQHPVGDCPEPIGPSLLHLEGISGIFKRQKPYIQYAFKKRLFAKESEEIIKQYLRFNLESDDDDVCDSSSDDASDDDISSDDDKKKNI